MDDKRVLVVDDDDSIRQMMVIALLRRGYDVTDAENGEVGLEIIKKQSRFSALVTDINMPGMSGLDLLREAKKLDPYIEVVMVTAAADLETAISALRAYSAYDYLIKPFESMQQLVLSVERAIAHRHLLIEREAMQAQIKHEAEMLRTLVLNTGDAIISANGCDALQIINPSAERLVGSSATSESSALTVLPQPFVQLITNWRTVGCSLPTVIEMPWSDGSVQMVSLTPVPANDASGTGWVAVLRDITHLKRLEELKMQLLTDASRKVSIPLAQAMNALVELSIVTSQNERAQDIIYRLSNVWSGIQKWGEDLNTLLQMDRETQLQEMPLDLHKLLMDICENQTDDFKLSYGVQLEMQLGENLPLVTANADMLYKLLQGLINRAVSRTEPGGKITIQASEQNKQVWIQIHDEGKSVSNNELSHLFDRSFTSGGGMRGSSGLEMALVKKIMDRMGGQVWVGGSVNLGSTISICLPAS